METIVTIKGHRVIDIYESFDGSYWFVTEKAWKQDSVINGTVHKDDQILFGYARLSACPQFAEFGYFSEAELKSLGNRIWKVPQKNWAICPEVEVRQTHERRGNHGARGGREAGGDTGAARLGRAVFGLRVRATTCRDGGLFGAGRLSMSSIRSPFCATLSGSQSQRLMDDACICQTHRVPRQSRGITY